MKKLALLNFALMLSTSSFIALPAMAQEVSATNFSLDTPLVTSEQGTLISQSAALLVKFSSPLQININNKKPYPLTLPLAQPLIDDKGGIGVPEGTPVMLNLNPIDSGVQILAEGLVIGGRIIPIQATSSVIPAIKVDRAGASDKVAKNGAIYGKLAGSVFGLIEQDDSRSFAHGEMLGTAVGMLAGLIGSKESDWVLQIPQNSTYTLELQAPVTLPASHNHVEQSP